MPTVAILGPYKLLIYFNDHGRPHVHILAADAAAVIELKVIRVIHNNGIGPKDMKRLLKFIEERKVELLEAWKDAQK